MRIEVIAIGSEIVAGRLVNTNATFISQQLNRMGWTVNRHTAVPDDPEILEKELKAALERSDVVITTGGLGPTCDDITRRIAAALFNSSSHVHPEVAEDLKRRYGDAPISLEDQATVPTCATPLINPIGTAPGLIFKKKKGALILLPGVPREMQALLLQQVIPFLQSHYSPSEKWFEENFCLTLHSESTVDPFLRELEERYRGIQIGIYPSTGILTIQLKSRDEAIFKGAKQALVKEYASYLFGPGTLEEEIHSLFTHKKKTLALAESCTGGMIAARLISVPGASDYFLGSMVAYSNALKKEWLSVSEKTMSQQGAVSEETVREMLEGIFERTSADVALAVSGIAGPTGGTADKPVGTIWAAIGERGKPVDVGHFRAPGDRQTIILFTTNRLLSFLWRKIKHGAHAFHE